jgi:hypothetical protein
VLAPPLRAAALIFQRGSKRFAPLHLPSGSAPPQPGHIYCLLSGVTLKFRAAILLTLLMALGAPSVLHAQSVTLAWDANTEPDIAGYRLYFGTTPGAYPNVIDVHNVTTYQLTGLDVSQNFYFAVQAYSTSGLSSELSTQVQLPAPVPPGTTRINSFSASAGYPLLAGVPVTWRTVATSLRGAVEYKYLKNTAATGWVVVQDFSPVETFTWMPGWNDVGTHTLQVWARTVGSPAPYEAWIGTVPFNVNAAPVTFTSSVDFPTPPGNPVQWTATVAGTPAGSTLEYKFYLRNNATGQWTILRDYATSNKATWTPGATGTYLVQIWARRVGSAAPYETVGTTGTLTISRSPLQVTALTGNVQLPARTGTPLTWTARVRGGSQGPIQYQFYRFSPSSGWTIVQPYSPSPTFSWTPAWNESGQYELQVWVRNGGSTAAFDAALGTRVAIERAPIHVSISHQFPVPPDTSVSFDANVADTSAVFEYQYWLYTQATGTWNILRPYSTDGTATWTPAQTGSYMLQVWSRRVGSTAPFETYYASPTLDVATGPAQALSVTSSVALPAAAGTSITWTALASGGTALPLQYKFYLFTQGVGWTVLRDYAAGNTFVWNAPAGTHRVQVWVRSAGSTQALESATQTDLFIIKP